MQVSFPTTINFLLEKFAGTKALIYAVEKQSGSNHLSSFFQKKSKNFHGCPWPLIAELPPALIPMRFKFCCLLEKKKIITFSRDETGFES